MCGEKPAAVGGIGVTAGDTTPGLEVFIGPPQKMCSKFGKQLLFSVPHLTFPSHSPLKWKPRMILFLFT